MSSDCCAAPSALSACVACQRAVFFGGALYCSSLMCSGGEPHRCARPTSTTAVLNRSHKPVIFPGILSRNWRNASSCFVLMVEERVHVAHAPKCSDVKLILVGWIENPRVGGSIPPLGTIISHLELTPKVSEIIYFDFLCAFCEIYVNRNRPWPSTSSRQWACRPASPATFTTLLFWTVSKIVCAGTPTLEFAGHGRATLKCDSCLTTRKTVKYDKHLAGSLQFCGMFG